MNTQTKTNNSENLESNGVEEAYEILANTSDQIEFNKAAVIYLDDYAERYQTDYDAEDYCEPLEVKGREQKVLLGYGGPNIWYHGKTEELSFHWGFKNARVDISHETELVNHFEEMIEMAYEYECMEYLRERGLVN